MGLNKGADWKEILSSTERRNFLSKGSGKGGKGHDKGGSACRVRRQGTKRSSLEHNVFKVYDIYDMPVVTVNERNGPLPVNSITDTGKLTVQSRARATRCVRYTALNYRDLPSDYLWTKPGLLPRGK